MGELVTPDFETDTRVTVHPLPFPVARLTDELVTMPLVLVVAEAV